MHIITQQRIWKAKELYKEAGSALDGWYRVMAKNTFTSFVQLREMFGSVDKVGDKYVFDIGGNKLRLIASIHFNRQKVYIRDILTHTEYNKGKWKK